MTGTQSRVTHKASWNLILAVLAKAALLFLVLNVIWAITQPLPALGKLSLYNSLFPGRLRFSFGDNPERSYSLSILQMEALLASHEIAGSAPQADEFRIVLVGDSSVWGYLQQAEQTLAAQISQAGWIAPDGRRVRAYNFGYPTLALSKDLLFLERAMDYQPDLILWFVTLESMPWTTQLDAPLLQYNPDLTRSLIERYDLPLNAEDERLITDDWFERTIVGQRRDIADWLRLQLYGVMWAGTGIDHEIPETYTPRMEDLEDDSSFHGFNPGELSSNDLAFSLLGMGISAAGDTPVLLVNEPIFVSQGLNSDVRYNFYYPRWAYDLYHAELTARADEQGWWLLDLWDALPAGLYTDSAIHYTPEGVKLVIDQLEPVLLEWLAETQME
jgi:hypothetical protein